MLQSSHDPALESVLLAPLFEALEAPQTKHSVRKCEVVSDQQFLTEGVLRVLENVRSGREFIQMIAQVRSSTTKRSNYFEMLASPRRLRLCEAVAIELMRQKLPGLRTRHDFLSEWPELGEREVWAADGHAIEHACHDRRDGESYLPVRHIYAIDLRTGWVRPVAMCQGREHEITTLKRKDAEPLRMGGKKGALWIYDRAALDLLLWLRLKMVEGIYFISRFKENMRPMHAVPLEWDRNDPRNAGVIADERVGFDNTGELRRVTYQDPVSGKRFEFLTSDMTLPPGCIADLYRRRWGVEKAFDEFENKLGESKAWGSSPSAKRMQSHFVALVRNLLLLVEAAIETKQGVQDQKIVEKRQRAAQAQIAEPDPVLGAQDLELRRVTLLARAHQKASQFSQQFLRWLRHHLRVRSSYAASMSDLATFQNAYL